MEANAIGNEHPDDATRRWRTARFLKPGEDLNTLASIDVSVNPDTLPIIELPDIPVLSQWPAEQQNDSDLRCFVEALKTNFVPSKEDLIGFSPMLRMFFGR
jgi:hypothetical protein